jgi:hypothetical protein
LDLVDEDARAQRVHGTRGEEDERVRPRRHPPEKFRRTGPAAAGLGQIAERHTRFQTEVEDAAWSGVQDPPGFRFSETLSVSLARRRVVGMDLDREVFAGVDQLHQQRKHRPAAGRGKPTRPERGPRPFRHDRGKVPATGRDRVRCRDDRLPDLLIGRERETERLQPSPAPRLGIQTRTQDERTGRSLCHRRLLLIGPTRLACRVGRMVVVTACLGHPVDRSLRAEPSKTTRKRLHP